MSEKQAKFLWEAFHNTSSDSLFFTRTNIHPSIKSWASSYEAGNPSAFTFQILELDKRYGRTLSKARYYGYGVVLDGAGVVAMVKLKIKHPTQEDPNLEVEGLDKEVFVRSGKPAPLYDPSITRKEQQQKITENQPLIDQIEKLPDYASLDILQSFVDQLKGGNKLTPAQMGVLRKFTPVEVGDSSEWQTMFRESMKWTEEKIIEPAIKVYSQYVQDHENDPSADPILLKNLRSDVQTTRKVWDSFKSNPSQEPNEYSYIWQLFEYSGWKKPVGVMGALDVLSSMYQLVKKAKKPPMTLLRKMRAMQDLHNHLDRLSASKMEHILEQVLQKY